MAVVLLTFITTGIILVITWTYQSYRRNKIFGKIPCPSGALPLLGNAHQLDTDGSKFYEQCMGFVKDIGQEGIFIIWLGIKPMICLNNPENIEILLNSSKNMDKGVEYRFLHPWLGTGLLTSTGNKWRSRRKMLTPTFHFKILLDFLGVFNDQADVMLSKLRKKAGSDVFDIFNDITLCALDIICESAMGRDVNAQSNSDSPYVCSVYKMSKLVQNRMTKPWYWPDLLFYLIGPGREHDRCLKRLHMFTQKVIKEKKEQLHKKTSKINEGNLTSHDSAEEDRFIGAKKHRLALLDMLLHMSNDGHNLTDQDISEEVDTFMFEGHDTTAAGISWATYLIGANPDVQERIQEELDSIFGSSDRQNTMEDLKNMKYLECCIKEALRLYPSVPMIARNLSEDVIMDGYLLPKGITVTIMVAGMHHDPKFFPNPNVFDPERFSIENKIGRHPFAYIPFSAGMRNCIGQKFAMMEEKVLLSTIFRNFKVETMQKEEDLQPMGEIILRPKHGIMVRLTARR